MAVSAQNRNYEIDFAPAARAAATMAEAVLERGMPRFTLLNMNVPFRPNKGFRATVQAKRNHVTVVSEGIEPRTGLSLGAWLRTDIGRWR